MKSQRLSWGGIYTTYRFCGHGLILSAWGASNYLRRFEALDTPVIRKGPLPPKGAPLTMQRFDPRVS
jgi:hypothetical protein